MATAQSVIQKFMNTLDNTKKNGTAALDEAVNAASGGKYKTIQKLIDSFMADWDKYDRDTFLRKCCGIQIDNYSARKEVDTGSITGYDAGGLTVKTPESIINESGKAVYPTAATTTIQGLTIIWPDKSKLTTDEKAIVAGLNSWWLSGALNLIKESYGLSFQEDGTMTHKMRVQFFNDASKNWLAAVESSYNPQADLILHVNMYYWKNFVSSNSNGISSDNEYLDRTIAHEMTHAVMSANMSCFNSLPFFVKEGLAELVHGADDSRLPEILTLTYRTQQNRNYLVNSVFDLAGTYNDRSNYPYAGGYMLFRYLGQQMSALPAGAIYTTTGSGENKARTGVVLGVAFSGTWNAKERLSVKTIDASKSTKPITIKAGVMANVIRAGKGGNNIYGQGGNDTIHGGTGKDIVWYGTGDGADTVQGFEAGKDTIRFYGNAKLDNTTIKGLNVILYSGKGSITIVGVAGKRVDIKDAKGVNTIHWFGRQDKANTFSYNVNHRYHGSTKYTDTITIKTGATLSLANTAIFDKIDILNASGAKNTVKLTGGNAMSTLIGGTKNDTLTAGKGGAKLQGNKGDDSLYGSAGADTFWYSNGDGKDTIWNYTSGKDVIRIAKGNLSGYSLSGMDVILKIGSGSIRIKNGIGRSITLIDAKGKKLVKNYAYSLPKNTSYNIKKTAIILNGNFTGTLNAQKYAPTVTEVNGSAAKKAITVYGTSRNDVLRAGNGGSNLRAMGGNDTLYGGAGKDVFWYGTGDGNDIIRNFQSGKDILHYYKGGMDSYTTTGTDVILKTGINSLKLVGMTNKRMDITDTNGKNTIHWFGRQDKSNSFTYAVNHRYHGSTKFTDILAIKTGATLSLANTTVFQNIDTINASASSGAVKLTGSSKASTLIGSTKADTLTAGTGDTVLQGGKGNDILYGGAGKDVFSYAAGDGHDIIYNYTSGKDTIKLRSGKIDSYAFSGKDVILKINNGSLRVKNAAGKAITFLNAQGTKTIKKYQLGPVYTYENNTNTVKLTNGNVYSAYLSGNDVLLKTNIGNIRIINGKDKILNIVNANGVKGTYKLTSAYPSSSNENLQFKNGTGSIALISGNGDSTLLGGSGNDHLYGSIGKNDFWWSPKNCGNDTIYNYTKGQDTIRVWDHEYFDGYIVSGNDVVLKSGTATLTIKNIKAGDINVVNYSDKKDTYWYDKKLPKGISINSANKIITINNTYGNYSFDLMDYARAKAPAEIDATAAISGVRYIDGDERHNIIRAGRYGMILNGGKGNDTLYGGAGNDEFRWISDEGNDVIYNYQKDKDCINIFASDGLKNYSVSGRDVIIQSNTGSTLTIRNTRFQDLCIYDVYNMNPAWKTSISPQMPSSKTDISYLQSVFTIDNSLTPKINVMSDLSQKTLGNTVSDTLSISGSSNDFTTFSDSIMLRMK